MREDSDSTVIALVQVNYADDQQQTYVLPLGFAAEDNSQHGPAATITTFQSGDFSAQPEAIRVFDATYDSGFTLGLLEAIREQRTIQSSEGNIVAWHTPDFLNRDVEGDDVAPSVMGAEQSNTSVKYGDKYILKLFRRLEEGESPELEFGRFLNTTGFKHSPPLMGAIEYTRPGAEPLTLAILQAFAPNQGDAWSFTLRSLARFFEHAMARAGESATDLLRQGSLLDTAGQPIPERMADLSGDYLAAARLLATRTAQLHLALGEGTADKAFAPEPFTPEYQTDLYRAMNSTARQAFDLLEQKMASLPSRPREDARVLLGNRTKVTEHFHPLLARSIFAERTRVHGDYHLGQVLYTGSDFLIIDFEGEPVRSLAERRMKHSPLKDVAGMLRSYDYAAYSALFDFVAKNNLRDSEDVERLEDWARAWQTWVSAAFLDTYLDTARGSIILPSDPEDLHIVLNANLLEKAVYELIYELNNRPDWVRIPLSGIVQLTR